ncbi:hypothetical protein T484DRAFT_1829600 [Baffinella frigidus]|nr:hypothetical protein T484DRAFT_1829600 [Cryptophyta sp. CCMP2293]
MLDSRYTSVTFGAEKSLNDGKADSNRKPIEGECTICFEALGESEELAWCSDGCGNNQF